MTSTNFIDGAISDAARTSAEGSPGTEALKHQNNQAKLPIVSRMAITTMTSSHGVVRAASKPPAKMLNLLKKPLNGGTPVTGWRRDGERFWCADLPGVKEGAWDFRALVVNGRMPERARLPESGAFVHKSVFDVRWLSSVGGGWERKPSPEELTTLRVKREDLGPHFAPTSAELTLFHEWDESLVGVKSFSGAEASACSTSMEKSICIRP